MKKRNLIALGAAAVLLAACIPSVNPFYTDKDVIVDSHLVGEWQDTSDTNNSEIWVFEQSTNKAFDLICTEEGNLGKFNAHLFKLKDERFLDLIPAKCEYASNQAPLVGLSMFPGHLLMRVQLSEPELKIVHFDFQWLAQYLTTNSAAIAHHSEDGNIVLTANTSDLQNFLLKHLGTNELFQRYTTMVRRPKP